MPGEPETTSKVSVSVAGTATNDEAEDDETADEDLLQFDFEASINAKKKTINGLVPNMSSSALSQSQAPSTTGTGNNKPGGDEFNPDSCDKEKMAAIKNKQPPQKVVFDMFADDDDYETVRIVLYLCFKFSIKKITNSQKIGSF